MYFGAFGEFVEPCRQLTSDDAWVIRDQPLDRNSAAVVHGVDGEVVCGEGRSCLVDVEGLVGSIGVSPHECCDPVARKFEAFEW